MRKKLIIGSLFTLLGISIVGCGSSGGGTGNNGFDITKPDIWSYPKVELTEAMKYSLSYMWHEEKLAKDIYLALNALYPNKQFENIATKSETIHEDLIKDLALKYDLNVTNVVDYKERFTQEDLDTLAQGEFAVTKIQDLYNTLYTYGKVSSQNALEVGCMVEVTDIDDLDKFLVDAYGAEDLIKSFEFLRAGSYKHYWAFDKALKNSGVSDGCCSLGTIDGVNYCHNEYPQ